MSDINIKSNKELENINDKIGDSKRVEKVITSNASTKKKSFFSKLKDQMLPEGCDSIGIYILNEVIIPEIGNIFHEILVGTADSLFGGRRVSYSSGKRISDRVSYRDRFDTKNSNQNRQKNMYDFDDIVVDTRFEADNILELMDETMSRYGVVRVADLYDAAGITVSYTAQNYGWTDISGMGAYRYGNQWVIRTPRAYPISK